MSFRFENVFESFCDALSHGISDATDRWDCGEVDTYIIHLLGQVHNARLAEMAVKVEVPSRGENQTNCFE